MHVLGKAGRLAMRHMGDDRSLRVVVRGRVPDTLHIDRAVAPTVSIHDDRCLVAGKEGKSAVPRREGN